MSRSYMYHHCAVGNLRYSREMCVQLLLMLTLRFVHQIAACQKGPNLKAKDLRTRVYMNSFNFFLDVQLTTKICTSNIKSHCIV
jgi:hypothetical protein